MKIIEPSYEILSPIDGQAMLRMIEVAARTSHKSEEWMADAKTTEEFLRRLLFKLQHESVFEHAWFTVRFIFDRGLSHELVRHRLGSPTQESTRYCNYAQDKFGNEITVIPMLTGLTEAQLERRRGLYREIERVYLAEISEGVKAQQARDNLPTCTKTEVVWTANLREWRHIFKLRTSPAAHPQMRKVMSALLADIKKLIPVVFEDLGNRGTDDH